MRINSLKLSPDRAGRYWVTFEDDSRLGLYRQTVEDFGLYTGMELSDDQLEALKTAAGQMSAKMRAVRIVSASSVSKRDLEHRLVRKGEDPEQAKAAVEWMEELHLVNDRNTAEQVVHSCISKGYGLQRAKQALYEKQIPKRYWEEALADYPDQSDKIEAFLLSRLDADSDEKEKKKAIDALLRRGHSYGTIRRVLNGLSFDTDDYYEEF
ncbi:MAG: RecX family transcriptional regulator [Oscillospiraceae bacterium]|nr:RecX family transcriptional regulator [Oscillospiraceae bacterium]MBQ7129555.1 RecX family transcriptional regulator [Oscillospiraceae bacterium]